MAARRALLVPSNARGYGGYTREKERRPPAPTKPMAMMELYVTSGSLSCENLLRVSRIVRRGLLVEMRPNASGTARLMAGSP